MQREIRAIQGEIQRGIREIQQEIRAIQGEIKGEIQGERFLAKIKKCLKCKRQTSTKKVNSRNK